MGSEGHLHARGVPAYPLITGAGYPTDGDNQAGYALALHFELLPKDLRKAAARRMVEKIHEYGDYLSTGIHATSRMMLELAKWGYVDLAYRLLMNRNVPSWAYQIEHGATTVWERWDGYVPERGFQTPYMNSFNHYGLGAVGEWIYRYVLGIHPDPDNPGYRHFKLQPLPGGGVTFADGTYESVRGKIASAWRQEDEKFFWKITVPVNTTATVYVPAAGVSQVTEGGQPIQRADGVQFLRFEDDVAVLRVSSGQYEFVSTPTTSP